MKAPRDTEEPTQGAAAGRTERKEAEMGWMKLFCDQPCRELQAFVRVVLRPRGYEPSKLLLGRWIDCPGIVQLMSSHVGSWRRRHTSSTADPVPMRHTLLTRPDGGTACLLTFCPACKAPGPSLVEPSVEPLPNQGAATPFVVFLAPTFMGTVENNARLIEALLGAWGCPVVLFQRRGVHCAMTSPAFYTTGNDDDLLAALERTHADWPGRRLVCLGESAGGTSLLRCLGKHRPPYVVALATVSSAIHADMYRGVPTLAARFLLGPAKAALAAYQRSPSGSGGARGMTKAQQALYARLQAVTTLDEFIDVERQLYEPDRARFREAQSIERQLPRLHVPTLIINGDDDPVCRRPLDHAALVAGLPRVLFLVTRGGSHCAFHARHAVPGASHLNWAQFVALSFLNLFATLPDCPSSLAPPPPAPAGADAVDASSTAAVSAQSANARCNGHSGCSGTPSALVDRRPSRLARPSTYPLGLRP